MIRPLAWEPPYATGAALEKAKRQKKKKKRKKIRYGNIYTVEYYSAIKKNKIMPFAATWMEPETHILSVVKKRKTNTI